MFIGHFTIAYIFHYIFPSLPLWVALVGVSFPDLLWPILVILGIEKATTDPKSPLQKNIKFNYYPYSHSLVLSTVIAFIFGAIISVLLNNAAILFLFPLLSASHWFLDAIVHRKDLPGPWLLQEGHKSRIRVMESWKGSLVLEYIFYIILTIVFAPSSSLILLLVLGTVFHMANMNSFLGFTKTNYFAKGKYTYPVITLLGFGLFIILATVM
jgi:hypothetical protein